MNIHMKRFFVGLTAIGGTVLLMSLVNWAVTSDHILSMPAKVILGMIGIIILSYIAGAIIVYYGWGEDA